jgi:hypothetical protein
LRGTVFTNKDYNLRPICGAFSPEPRDSGLFEAIELQALVFLSSSLLCIL